MPRFIPFHRAPLFGALAVLVLTAVTSPAGAQTDGGPSPIFAGDSVRIDGDLVGRVLSVDGPRLTVVSRGPQSCRAGVMHGDAPICDPAPLVRNEMDLSEVRVERRMQKDHINRRTITGGLIGGAVFGAAGWFIGESIGFGRIDGCNNAGSTVECGSGGGLTPEERAAEQKRQDQIRGALFFGAIGATAAAIFARKTSVGWVEVEPTIPFAPSEPWGITFSVPTSR